MHQSIVQELNLCLNRTEKSDTGRRNLGYRNVIKSTIYVELHTVKSVFSNPISGYKPVTLVWYSLIQVNSETQRAQTPSSYQLSEGAVPWSNGNALD